MFSTKTLPFVLLFAFLLSLGHSSDGMDITPTRIEDPQPRKFLKFSSSDYKPLNITFDHSSRNPLLSFPSLITFQKDVEIDYSRTARYLNETVFPAVQTFFRSAVQVLPRKSRILVKPEFCGDSVKVPKYASKTGYDTDLVIFVKFVFSAPYLASSSSCTLDGTTSRF